MKLRNALLYLRTSVNGVFFLSFFNGPINDVCDDLHFLLLFEIIYASRQMGN